MEEGMVKRGDRQYLEERAREALHLARLTEDRPTRSIYLKTAKCYHDLARAIERREQIRANAKVPGREH
jgi:hypothetical protein